MRDRRNLPLRAGVGGVVLGAVAALILSLAGGAVSGADLAGIGTNREPTTHPAQADSNGYVETVSNMMKNVGAASASLL